MARESLSAIQDIGRVSGAISGGWAKQATSPTPSGQRTEVTLGRGSTCRCDSQVRNRGHRATHTAGAMNDSTVQSTDSQLTTVKGHTVTYCTPTTNHDDDFILNMSLLDPVYFGKVFRGVSYCKVGTPARVRNSAPSGCQSSSPHRPLLAKTCSCTHRIAELPPSYLTVGHAHSPWIDHRPL